MQWRDLHVRSIWGQAGDRSLELAPYLLVLLPRHQAEADLRRCLRRNHGFGTLADEPAANAVNLECW